MEVQSVAGMGQETCGFFVFGLIDKEFNHYFYSKLVQTESDSYFCASILKSSNAIFIHI
jgi:hypothetical protein